MGNQFQLWTHQQKAIDELRATLKEGKRRVVVVLPTGGGKTGVAAEVSRRLANKEMKMLFIVHRQELVDQAEKSMREMGISTVRITAGRTARIGAAQMSICTIQTLDRRLQKLKRAGMRPLDKIHYVWWDECHHIAATTWKRVSETLRGWYPNLREIGLTATPRRPDGKGLDVVFEDIVEAATMRELMDSGHLCDYRIVSTKTNLSELRKQMRARASDDDYSKKGQSDAIVGKLDLIAGETVDLYRKYVDGQKAIVFCVDVAHSKRTAAAFIAAGIPAANVDGEMNIYQRRRLIRKFRDGDLKVLCNVMIVTEGFDAPEASVVVFARHTKSIVFYLQAIGRALRGRPGKVATIIDQAANYQNKELGWPDEERIWSLAGDSGKKAMVKKKKVMRACRKCGYFSHSRQCPKCGAGMVEITDVRTHKDEFDIVGGKQSAGTAGEQTQKQPQISARIGRAVLNQNLSQIYSRHERHGGNLLEMLKDYAAKIGYKEGWALNTYARYKRVNSRKRVVDGG